VPQSFSDSDSNITDTHPDFLSPLAEKILREQKPSAYQKLVVRGATPQTARELLSHLQPADLLSVAVQDQDEAKAVLAAMWLYLDGLDESHHIVQNLVGPTGAFWHAIMHRLEGDFPNAKYWYGRCETHRCMKLLGTVATDVVGKEAARDPAVQHIVAGEWNADAFVDLVAKIHDKPDDPRFTAAVRLQQIEWHTLFQHCVHEAVGAAE
jgi:hypothetical protein